MFNLDTFITVALKQQNLKSKYNIYIIIIIGKKKTNKTVKGNTFSILVPI